jgi:hypothetical protein
LRLSLCTRLGNRSHIFPKTIVEIRPVRSVHSTALYLHILRREYHLKMEALLQVPYFADPSTLPGPIPSIEEIESSSNRLNQNGAHRAVRVGEHFVVKYGELVYALEADNMMFISKQTSIPVPQLYAVFRSPVKPAVLYIVMQYIHGNTLMAEWPIMSEAQKSAVGKKLRSYFAQLRELPSPSYYGSRGRGHMPNSIFWDAEGAYLNPAISGPFETEADFNNGIVLKSRSVDEQNKRRGYKTDFYERFLPVVLRGHSPTFTHGDFQRKNVIVRRNEQNELEGHEDDYEVTLIDWEMAGWYPDYWEYCAAACAFAFSDDWADKVGDILDPYPVEYPWLLDIGLSLWS